MSSEIMQRKFNFSFYVQPTKGGSYIRYRGPIKTGLDFNQWGTAFQKAIVGIYYELKLHPFQTSCH